ncbi:hypothetical protein NL348_27470, partial [Klebsiella pneumoniae]|nr:hypothetical protein [Klebsiella pneumoniae]
KAGYTGAAGHFAFEIAYFLSSLLCMKPTISDSNCVPITTAGSNQKYRGFRAVPVKAESLEPL